MGMKDCMAARDTENSHKKGFCPKQDPLTISPFQKLLQKRELFLKVRDRRYEKRLYTQCHFGSKAWPMHS